MRIFNLKFLIFNKESKFFQRKISTCFKMKKLFLLFFAVAVLIILSLTPGPAKAANICNESSNVDAEVNGTAEFNKDNSGKNGIVPCGRSTATNPATGNYTFRIICIPFVNSSNFTTLATVSISATSLSDAQTQMANYNTSSYNSSCPPSDNNIFKGNLTSVSTNAASTTLTCPCQLSHVFILIFNVYKFIVFNIATPLAALLMVIGGIVWVVSAGNPGMLDTGKRMFKGAIWGIVLIFGSWIIVNVVLIAIGYTGGWSGIEF